MEEPIIAPPLFIGDIRIDRIIEATVPFVDAKTFFPTMDDAFIAEHRDWLEPRFIDPESGKVILCFQSYLVRDGRNTILIDSCIGNDKDRPTRPMFHKRKSDRMMRGLAALGLTVSDIDHVMCTHLHFDHVGWNTQLVDGHWMPTFPNARYVFSEKELNFWTKQAEVAPQTCPWIADSVAPIVEAKRHVCVGSDHDFDAHLRLIPTPGHTIDHFSVEIGGKTPDAIIGGDMVHSACQIRFPDMGMMSDWDSSVAGDTRRALFSRIADTPTKLCTAHFAGNSVVHITDEGGVFGFRDG